MNQLSTFEDSTSEQFRVLKKIVQKKKKILQKTIEKVELLAMELDEIRERYNARIGWLYIKDNKLDLEIIKYKSVADLVALGKTVEEAVKEVEKRHYDLLLETETVDNIPMQDIKKTEILPSDTPANIRNLWKKLVLQFHPDLVQDKQEKEKRELLIKKINKAYRENDLETLQRLEHNIFLDSSEETSVSLLENSLARIENATASLKKKYVQLKNSQWYQWKINLSKAKKTGKDLFAELEKTLLDDIGRKIDVLNRIKSNLNAAKPQAAV